MCWGSRGGSVGFDPTPQSCAHPAPLLLGADLWDFNSKFILVLIKHRALPSRNFWGTAYDSGDLSARNSSPQPLCCGRCLWPPMGAFARGQLKLSQNLHASNILWKNPQIRHFKPKMGEGDTRGRVLRPRHISSFHILSLNRWGSGRYWLNATKCVRRASDPKHHLHNH